MSLDLQDYFNLGLESTNSPIENAGMINVFRTPVDSSSTNLNRITFKFPKTGMLTGDSMITLQPILSDSTATTSNVTPNFINGVIGSIKRTRLLVDGKVLVDLARPGLAQNVKLYSRNTQVELAEKEYKIMGNQFVTQIKSDGSEAFNVNETRVFSNQDDENDNTITKNIILQEATSKVYGIPLKHLGCDFLEASALPVFLLGHREMILELEFFPDCREYVCNPSGGTINAGDVKINLPNCELVSTHIMLPPDVEAQEIMNMRKQPVSYPLLDTYVINGVVDTTTGVGVQKSETYRINFQNREVHNLMICSVDTDADSSLLVGNQKAIGLGDESLQLKVNGLNLYDRPIVSQPLIYQQTTYSEEGRTLKIPLNAWNVSDKSLNCYKQNTDPLYLDYRGNFHYVKIDFSNGNGGVFGSGTMMKMAAEIDYKFTPRTNVSPKQDDRKDMLFYTTISKLMSIGANQVNISY